MSRSMKRFVKDGAQGSNEVVEGLAKIGEPADVASGLKWESSRPASDVY